MTAARTSYLRTRVLAHPEGGTIALTGEPTKLPKQGYFVAVPFLGQTLHMDRIPDDDAFFRIKNTIYAGTQPSMHPYTYIGWEGALELDRLVQVQIEPVVHTWLLADALILGRHLGQKRIWSIGEEMSLSVR